MTLEVTDDSSLSELGDCGARNNFVRRQSLDSGSLIFVEQESPSNEDEGAPSDRRIDKYDVIYSDNTLRVERQTL